MNKFRCRDGWQYYAVLFAILLICHAFSERCADDIRYLHELDNKTYIEFIKEHYLTWSSRLVIDSSIVLFSKCNMWLWRIVDSLMFVLIAMMIDLFWGKSQHGRSGSISCLVVLLFPLWMINSTGWIATTVTYVWPIALGLLSLLPLVDTSYAESKWRYLFLLPLLYAANAEQTCCVLFAFGMMLTGYHYNKGRKNILGYGTLYVSICFCLLLLFLLCPGNHVRTIDEIASRWPEFATLGLTEKLSYGMATTFSRLFTYEWLYVFFCLTLLLAAIARKERMCILASVLLLALPLLYTSYATLYSGAPITHLVLGSHQLPAAGSIHFVGIIVLGVLSVLLITWLLWSLFEHKLLPPLIFLAGFASRLLLSFSPTLFASGTRTMFLFYMSMVILVYMLYEHYLSVSNEKPVQKCFKLGSFAFAVGNILFFFFLHAHVFYLFK